MVVNHQKGEVYRAAEVPVFKLVGLEYQKERAKVVEATVLSREKKGTEGG